MKKGLFLLSLCLFLLGFLSFETNAEEISLERGEEVFYDGYSTFYYYIDGELGYCLEPYKNSPHNGTFSADLLEENILLSKALYYVYGGPGYEVHMRGHFSEKWQEQGQAYCLSHCILSYIYDEQDESSPEFQTLSQEMKEQVKWCVQILEQLPDIPCPEIGFLEDNLIAYYDKNSNIQRTKTIFCEGDEENFIEFYLQDNVTLVNETRKTESQGLVKVWGGDTFYLKTDASLYNGEYWDSGLLYGANKQKWRALIIDTGESGQHLGSGHLITVDQEPDSFSVKWLDKPELVVCKSADKEDKVYKVGDVITYTIEVTQRIENAVANNTVITDTIITEGVELLEDSVQVSDCNDNPVSGVDIFVSDNSYTLQMNDSLQGPESGERYIIKYQVTITDEALIGKEVENEVVVRAENAEEVRDTETVLVKEPVNPVITKKTASVKTGDGSEPILLILLCILSCITMVKCGIIDQYKSN